MIEPWMLENDNSVIPSDYIWFFLKAKERIDSLVSKGTKNVHVAYLELYFEDLMNMTCYDLDIGDEWDHRTRKSEIYEDIFEAFCNINSDIYSAAVRYMEHIGIKVNDKKFDVLAKRFAREKAKSIWDNRDEWLERLDFRSP